MQGFAALAIARIAAVAPGRLMGRIAQVIGQLALQGRFQRALGDPLEQTVLAQQLLGIAPEVLEQLVQQGFCVGVRSVIIASYRL